MSKNQVDNKESGSDVGLKKELLKLFISNKKLIIASVSVIFTITFGVYKYISGVQNFEQKNKELPLSAPKKDIEKIEKEEEITIPNIPSLPDFSKINNQSENVDLPPAPVEKKEEPPVLPSDVVKPLPIVQNTSVIDKTQNEDREKKEARRKSGIIQIGGAGSGGKPMDDPSTSSVMVSLKKKGNLDYVLSKGKIINATIESSVSSDIGGEVRAIISQDVYSEGNKNILIPKGSRVFGIYSKGYKEPYGRIEISWRRVDLPNGYVIEFSGDSIDNLGKIGSEGRVDMKHGEKISNAALTSFFDIGFAKVLDGLITPDDKEQKSASLNTAQSVKSSVITIYGQQGIDPKIKITQICAQAKSLIKDQTSASYISIDQACNQALVSSVSGTTDINSILSSLVISVNGAADQLVINASKIESKAQKASQDAFNKITKSVSDALDQKNFNPTTTIDQGSSIQIYVNEDYMFPKESIRNVRILR